METAGWLQTLASGAAGAILVFVMSWLSRRGDNREATGREQGMVLGKLDAVADTVNEARREARDYNAKLQQQISEARREAREDNARLSERIDHVVLELRGVPPDPAKPQAGSPEQPARRRTARQGTPRR